MIIGIGLDLVEISRVEKIWKRYGLKFAQKILHLNELDLLPDVFPVQFLAGRFAAKEAISKALGTGFSNGVTFLDICITKLANGKPEAVLLGQAGLEFQKLGGKRIFISITHSRDAAAAVAVIET